MRSLVGAVIVGVLALSGCGSTGVGDAADGTVVGTVLAAPSCPVERSGSPCPPTPVTGARVVALRGKSEAAQTVTGAKGAFQLRVPVGTYTLVATNAGAYASTARRSVVVPASGTVTVTLTVDSGIR